MVEESGQECPIIEHRSFDEQLSKDTGFRQTQ